MNCDHWDTKWVWSSWQNDWTGEEEGEWDKTETNKRYSYYVTEEVVQW